MDPVAFDGVLIIDKPTGPTSHDIVACVRRTLSLKKVGHLGTLDPLATGVLPLVVGRATRLASLLAGASKQYDAVIRLGLITDTYDITGTVVGGADAPRRGAALRFKHTPRCASALPTREGNAVRLWVRS